VPARPRPGRLPRGQGFLIDRPEPVVEEIGSALGEEHDRADTDTDAHTGNATAQPASPAPFGVPGILLNRRRAARPWRTLRSAIQTAEEPS
jgi:hypothetical protein